MTRPLEGRIAVVAGACRGIGKGIAVELGAAGATVYALGRTLQPGTGGAPGSLMFHKSYNPAGPVLWLNHDIVAKQLNKLHG